MSTLFKFLGAIIGTFVLLIAVGLLAAKNTSVLMVFSFAAPVILFLFPRVSCTSEVYKMEKDGDKGLSKLLCYIPIYNTYYSRKLQYYRAPVIGGLLLFVAIELFIVNPICRFVMLGSTYAIVYNVIASYLNILAIIILWCVEAYVNVQLCKQTGYNAVVLSIVLPPVASFFIAKKVNVFFRNNKNELRGTFHGVKSKGNKRIVKG